MKWLGMECLLVWADAVIVAMVGLQLFLAGAFNDPRWLIVKREILVDAFLVALALLLYMTFKFKTRKPAPQKQDSACQGTQLKHLPFQ